MPLMRPVEVKPMPPDGVWLRYPDGVEGRYDLRPLMDRGGLFTRLNDADYLNRVRLGPAGEVQWDDEMELCSDAIYLELTNASIKQLPISDDLREAG